MPWLVLLDKSSGRLNSLKYLNGADSKVQEWGQSGTSAACATLALGTRTMGRVSYISLISIPLWRISSSVGLLSIVLLW
jgi:hypothetical protein